MNRSLGLASPHTLLQFFQQLSAHWFVFELQFQHNQFQLVWPLFVDQQDFFNLDVFGAVVDGTDFRGLGKDFACENDAFVGHSYVEIAVGLIGKPLETYNYVLNGLFRSQAVFIGVFFEEYLGLDVVIRSSRQLRISLILVFDRPIIFIILFIFALFFVIIRVVQAQYTWSLLRKYVCAVV